jgi:16S rRNA (uracil1498-N3)-methyltransferase
MSQLWAWVKTLGDPGLLTLTPEESRHVASRRLRKGDELVVFDAKGHTASARIESLAKRAVVVQVDSIESTPPPSSGFGLATAIPKGERLAVMLQMWTQLGLESWQPLLCEDSAVRKIDVESARLRRILIEGCKVARRPFAMQMLPPLRLEDAVKERGRSARLFYGDRAGSRRGFDAPTGWLFIGPEAGFSESEQSILCAAGATALSFGEYNLRIETAAVAALAAFNVSGASGTTASAANVPGKSTPAEDVVGESVPDHEAP